MSRRVLLSALGMVALSGCGSGAETATSVTHASAGASAQPPTASAPATAPTDTSQAPSYPLVHFTVTDHTTNPVGVWPFTARLVRVTENPNGFPASQPPPPQDTYLMVQVAITSAITGRSVGAAVPRPRISCHPPDDQQWSHKLPEGYDQGTETEPELEGNAIAFGDGQPHLWDTEWQVPEGTSTTDVKCSIASAPPTTEEALHVLGSGALN
ncbi:MAG TPA: hypothetical protein VK680_13630 [Solirubrobacteraceae bacterium]|nr:hypothetical protein [Solirubrobacteraceae bacterium]